MQFNLPTTKNQMYTVLNDLFYYYRVRREGYEEINLVQLDLPRLSMTYVTDATLVEKATNLLKSQHEREILTYEKEINSQILELEQKATAIEQNALSEIENLRTLYDESVKKIEYKVLNTGLHNSSILVDKTVMLEDSLNDKIAKITQNKNEQIAAIQAKITTLQNELSNSQTYFSAIHQLEIDKKVIELKDEQEKLEREIFKYNNGLEEKEQRYANTIKETKSSLYLRFLDISSGEFTKDQLIDMGYYTDVIKCVRGYYDTLSPADAYRDMHAEGKLAIYLDDYYQNVLYAYKLASGL